MEKSTNATKCSHCGKPCDEVKCIEQEGKTFCCEKCCGDWKKKEEKGIKVSPNVCKFC